jgi:hypothetical protein
MAHPLGGCGVPPIGIKTPTMGLDNHNNLDGDKIKVDIEGGGQTYTRNFEQASYMAQITAPMLLRADREGGLTWVILDVPTTMTARSTHGSMPAGPLLLAS